MIVMGGEMCQLDNFGHFAPIPGPVYASCPRDDDVTDGQALVNCR